MSNLLELQNLHVSYHTPRGTVQAVRGVDLTLQPGEVLAIVGESGCGKSALCKAIMRLLPDNADIEGRILVNGTDIAPYPEKELQKLRGRLFSMVFQDPMTALNPSMTIGAQIAEAVLVHEPKISRDALRARVLELMELVGIDRPNARMKLYPHNFSGGMRQRAVLAIALASRAKILLADEPTTALDVTIQSQILELINKLKEERKLSVIFITHDLGVVANMADKIAVMYAGKIVEYGTADDIFYDSRHPYTWALLSSMPDLDTDEKLDAIPGTPPNMIYPPVGDAFAERNKYALKIDFEMEPPKFEVSPTHWAATWLLHPDAPKVPVPKAITDRIQRMKKLGGAEHGEQ